MCHIVYYVSYTMCHILCVIVAIISLIHYQHVMVILMEDKPHYKCYVGLNRLAFAAAVVCAIGLMLVGSFQVTSCVQLVLCNDVFVCRMGHLLGLFIWLELICCLLEEHFIVS